MITSPAGQNLSSILNSSFASFVKNLAELFTCWLLFRWPCCGCSVCGLGVVLGWVQSWRWDCLLYGHLQLFWPLWWVPKLRCTGKSFVQFVLFHKVLQSSFICNNQEMDIPLWGAPLVLFISPVSRGIDSELASVDIATSVETNLLVLLLS